MPDRRGCPAGRPAAQCHDGRCPTGHMDRQRRLGYLYGCVHHGPGKHPRRQRAKVGCKRIRSPGFWCGIDSASARACAQSATSPRRRACDRPRSATALAMAGTGPHGSASPADKQAGNAPRFRSARASVACPTRQPVKNTSAPGPRPICKGQFYYQTRPLTEPARQHRHAMYLCRGRRNHPAQQVQRLVQPCAAVCRRRIHGAGGIPTAPGARGKT